MEPLFYDLGHGQTLLCLPSTQFKSELLSLSFAVPLSPETAQSNALAMSVCHRGTVKDPTLAKLNRHLDELFSSSIASRSRRTGDMQRLGFFADLLGARYVGGGTGLLSETTEVLSDILLAPALDEDGFFRAEYVESEKNNLRDAIRSAINNPSGYALRECAKLLCAGEPYAYPMIGELDTVDAITPETLTARYRALLAEAVPSFFYVGATPAHEVAALLKERFGGMRGTAASYTALYKMPESIVRGGTEMPLCQGKLAIGFRTDIRATDPEAPALLVLNELFGGSPASKLFLNVREKRSLCYSCSSSFDIYKGVMFAAAGMKPDNRAVVEEAIFGEYEALSRGEISDVEWEAAKRSLDHYYRQAYDSPPALANFYLARRCAGISEPLESWRARVADVRREDVLAAAARLKPGAVYFLKGTKEGEAEE